MKHGEDSKGSLSLSWSWRKVALDSPNWSISAVDAYKALLTRRSIGRLTEPAPDRATVRDLLRAATAAPDHGLLRPWRFVVIRDDALRRLGEVFAEAHTAREPGLAPQQREKIAAKPLRAPLIVAVIACPTPSPKIPEWEQHASAACAAHNLCLAAHALGYGAMWRTGSYGDDAGVRAHLGMADSEHVTGWIYLGTAAAAPASPPSRAVDADAITTELGAEPS